MSNKAKYHQRHPKRKWFGVEDRSHMSYLQIRDGPKQPAAMDSPVVKAELTPLPAILSPTEVKELGAEIQVNKEAKAGIVESNKPKLKPWELREKYPHGWVSAPYVKLPIYVSLIVRNQSS